jgi:hypothetical protein
MTEVYKYDDIDFSKLKFTKPEKRHNVYYSNISYGDKPFFLQTSKLKIISDIESMNMKLPSIEFQILGDNLDLYDLFMQLDDKIVKTTYSKGEEWFNQNIPLENIEEMYKCICKPLKKYKNPTIRFKLPLENDEILSKIYDQNRKIVNIKDIKKEQEAICIVHIRGIKFMKQQYICDIYINQMKIYVPKNNDFLIPDECIINDLDENNSDEEIIDDEVIREIDDKKQKLIRDKNKELKKLKILEEKIKKMTSQIDD